MQLLVSTLGPGGRPTGLETVKMDVQAGITSIYSASLRMSVFFITIATLHKMGSSLSDLRLLLTTTLVSVLLISQ